MTDIITMPEPKLPKGRSAVQNLLTVAQAAELKGVTPQAIRRAIADGRLPAYPMGKAWMLRRRDVEAYSPVGRGHKKVES